MKMSSAKSGVTPWKIGHSEDISTLESTGRTRDTFTWWVYRNEWQSKMWDLC